MKGSMSMMKAVNRVSAAIILLVYVTLMHPMIAYGEEGNGGTEEVRLLMGLPAENEREVSTK